MAQLVTLTLPADLIITTDLICITLATTTTGNIPACQQKCTNNTLHIALHSPLTFETQQQELN